MITQLKVPIEVKMNMEEIIDRLKKDDFVQVVRCKDCKWYYRGGATCMYWDGENNMRGDDYCSGAEREEHETD